ncbi:MAG: hypothetical protein ABJ327_09040 [Litoreibacter sp.]
MVDTYQHTLWRVSAGRPDAYLQAVDPIEAMTAFDHRRKMSTTGVFKAIQPYSPE